MFVKKFLAVFMVAVCVISFCGCDNGQYYDENYDIECVTGDFFGDLEPYTEYEELTELNKAIEKIKAVDIGYGEEFTEFDILYHVKSEIEDIRIYWPVKHDASTVGFTWFDGDTVNVDLLEARITQNTENNGIEITDELAMYIRKTAEACKADIEYILENFPDFYFSCAFDKVDMLYVDFTTDEECLAYCAVTGGEPSGIFYNREQLEKCTAEEAESTFYHEVAHLLSQCVHEEIVFNGLEINNVATSGAPLNSYYFSEFFAIYMQSVFVYTDEENYRKENGIIDLWTLSTGTIEDDFAKAFAYKDVETVINMIEPELRDPQFYFSLFYAFDLWSEISDGEENYISDIEQFREDCFRYFYINIMRNGYIRLMKEYACGEITAEEAADKAADIYVTGSNYIQMFVDDYGRLNEETLTLCFEKTDEMETVLYDYIGMAE